MHGVILAAATRSSTACGIVALVGAAALFACAVPTAERDAVVYASGADLESANPLVTVHPLSRQVQRYALFVTLARHDSALEARPYYARSWQWSDDRRVLRLSLEPSLRWHDGTPTTSRDVAFTITAAMDPATGYPRAGELRDIVRLETPDDTTIAIRFSRSPPSFPTILCELPIVPAHLLEREPRATLRRAAFNTAPVGNGPFRFVDRTPGQRWTFERNADFPESLGGPPQVRRLVIAVVDEPTTKFAGLVSGDLDVAGIAPNMASLARRDPRLDVLSYPVSFSTVMVFNVAQPPFDDVRVRRAIASSIRRERIVDVALAGFGTPAVGPIAPDHPFASAPVDEVPLAADSLLDSAGWQRGADGRRTRSGAPLTFTLLTVGSGDNAIEQLIQADLRAHGIAMEIRQMEFGAFLAAARASPKRFDALLTGIPGDVSLSHLSAMFETRQAGGTLDFGGYHTPRLDSLLGDARAAHTPDEARAAWARVHRELDEESPVAWIYHARGVQGIARRLNHVRMDLRGEMATLASWTLDGDRAR
jgi:peptide/nickel transport system substrate-binding protein